jgi:hypothetical protein
MTKLTRSVLPAVLALGLAAGVKSVSASNTAGT